MIHTLVRSTYLSTLELIGYPQRLLRRIQREGLTLLLNLHRISPEPNDFYPPLHPRDFEALVRFFLGQLHITTLAGLAALKPHEPAVVFSFDDGFLDFVEYAMPILAKYNIVANLNIIPECQK